MAICFCHVDPGFPFLWEDDTQPPARWHGEGEGPAQYLADTPDGAWAEYLRHEEITDAGDLAGVRRALWAVEVPEEPAAPPRLPRAVLLGGADSYGECQAEARRLRQQETTRLTAPSAALKAGEARGQRVDGGLQPGPPRDGTVTVLFGRRPDLVGWLVVADGRPPDALLQRVRHL